LQFGDQEQIAAYQYLERIAEIELLLGREESANHLQAVEDALGEYGWLQHIRLEVIRARKRRNASPQAGRTLLSPPEAQS
jgi:hypothetical protein